MANGVNMGTLGLGSNSVLNNELIEKMKSGEESQIIQPYTDKIEKNTAKQTALTELNTKLLTFKTAVSSLGDSSAFSARKVNASVTGDNAAASLSAGSGVAVQSLSVKVNQIAEKDVFQTKGLKSDTDRVFDNIFTSSSSAVENVTFTLVQDKKNYAITVNKNDTFEDLVTKINNATDGKIVAKMINTGEENTPYRMTLSSGETGSKNAISFVAGTMDTAGNITTNLGSTKLLEEAFGWKLNTQTQPTSGSKEGYKLEDTNGEYHIKKAQNAEFILDGVKMIRSSNEVKDIGAGMTLTLKKTGEINFDVKQDTESITKTMEELVEAYNDLMNQLETATKYDTETKVAGELQGVTQITSIRSTIINTLFDSQSIEGTEIDENGDKKAVNVMLSMYDYGLELSKDGKLTFDKTAFDEKVGKDIDLAEKFFAGVNGFEELNHSSERVSNITSPIDFDTGGFKITFNDITYDLSKDINGNPWKLDGNSTEEMMKKLVDHINSFRIEDLDVKMQEVKTLNGKEYTINFKSDNGSDFEIEGNETKLEKIGLKAVKITPELEEGTGIFAALKTELDNMTNSKTGSLTLYEQQLKNESKALEESRKTSQERLDARYETLRSQWIEYEKIISKLLGQQEQITQMINAANQKK